MNFTSAKIHMGWLISSVQYFLSMSSGSRYLDQEFFIYFEQRSASEVGLDLFLIMSAFDCKRLEAMPLLLPSSLFPFLFST